MLICWGILFGRSFQFALSWPIDLMWGIEDIRFSGQSPKWYINIGIQS